jgi:hypothetical protein
MDKVDGPVVANPKGVFFLWEKHDVCCVQKVECASSQLRDL